MTSKDDYIDELHAERRAITERLRTETDRANSLAVRVLDAERLLAEAERERDVLRGYWQRVLRHEDQDIVFDFEELKRILLECVTADSASPCKHAQLASWVGAKGMCVDCGEVIPADSAGGRAGEVMHDQVLYDRIVARIDKTQGDCWIWTGPGWYKRKSPGNRYGFVSIYNRAESEEPK
jgi:hypothetical protein